MGRRLKQRLLDSGRYIVFAAGRHPHGDNSENFVELDLCNEESVFAAMEAARPEIVFHLAAQSSSSGATASPSLAWEVNLIGTHFLAKAIHITSPNATLIFASSVEVYGFAFNSGNVDENTTPRPISVYGKSKYAAELLLNDVLTSSNRLVIARPTNHSGAGQSETFVIPSFARQVVDGVNPIMTGNISVVRDFLHVDDVVSAYIDIAKNASALPDRSVFNIASGHPISLESILKRLLRIAGSHAQIAIDPRRVRNIDVPVTAIDSSAVRNSLGWKPLVPIDDLLREILYSFES